MACQLGSKFLSAATRNPLSRSRLSCLLVGCLLHSYLCTVIPCLLNLPCLELRRLFHSLLHSLLHCLPVGGQAELCLTTALCAIWQLDPSGLARCFSCCRSQHTHTHAHAHIHSLLYSRTQQAGTRGATNQEIYKAIKLYHIAKGLHEQGVIDRNSPRLLLEALPGICFDQGRWRVAGTQPSVPDTSASLPPVPYTYCDHDVQCVESVPCPVHGAPSLVRRARAARRVLVGECHYLLARVGPVDPLLKSATVDRAELMCDPRALVEAHFLVLQGKVYHLDDHLDEVAAPSEHAAVARVQ